MGLYGCFAVTKKRRKEGPPTRERRGGQSGQLNHPVAWRRTTDCWRAPGKSHHKPPTRFGLCRVIFLRYTIRLLSRKYEPLTQGMVSTQTTTGPVRSVMYRMNFVCCATNHSQESVNSPHSFCPFIRGNMAEEEEEEVTGLVAHSESGMCKAGFCW